MGRKHRPKISKIIIPPREVDFIKDGIPSGYCLLCEEWIGVNGHDHQHQHQPPNASTEIPSKEVEPVKLFPKMAETPHIIVSPDVDGLEEPQFPKIDEDPEDESPNFSNEVESYKETPIQNSVKDESPPVTEKRGTPEISKEVPHIVEISQESPPLYSPSMEKTLVYKKKAFDQPYPPTEPKTEINTESVPEKQEKYTSKRETEKRRSQVDVDMVPRSKEPLKRSGSVVLVSREEVTPPIDVYGLPPMEQPMDQERNEPFKASHYHSHSVGNVGNPSLHGHSLKNENSNLDTLELFEKKTRRHSMIELMQRAASQTSLNAPTQASFGVHKSVSRISLVTSTDGRKDAFESLILCVSALYGKLLVVMGMAFPIAEILSEDVPFIFYNTFYLYLYFGSILFLIYAYLFLLRAKSLPSMNVRERLRSMSRFNKRRTISSSDVRWTEFPMPETAKKLIPKNSTADEHKPEKMDEMSVTNSMYKGPKYTITETNNHGSMYLKMGAVLFGVGSMIYSGLEFGQYFELRNDSECANIIMAIAPVARMIFIFLQMYFIFLNSRVAISKHTIIARFGLMHMIATNLCIWLNVLVQETEHEIVHLTQRHSEHGPSNSSHHGSDHGGTIIGDPHHPKNESEPIHVYPPPPSFIHHDPAMPQHGMLRALRSLDVAFPSILEDRTTNVDQGTTGCRRLNIMGNVVSSASPFLFPCTIEYSLLCAGVLYVMWKNINVLKTERTTADADSEISNFIARKVRHHYSVDCARASRGLFMGIFVLVLTIISLILFYVLISNESFLEFAILEANIIELSIYSLSLISVVIGMKQLRELEFFPEGDIELDNILLLIAQAGVYIYTSFTIIGDYFSLEQSPFLSLSTAIITLIQTTLQTMFILDGSRRCCHTPEQHERKPGREMVTFLLVCNLALWAICTFETSRADVHPTQLHFYGIWAWTIISHVSMPLAIFYRFHVTVCLGEIWKRSYKIKQEGVHVDSFR